MEIYSVGGIMTRLHLVGLALTVSIAGCSQPQEEPTPDYEYDAAGAQIQPELRIEIAGITPDEPFGLISGASVCGGYLFGADPRNGVVHQIQLSSGIRIQTLGGREVTDEWAPPETAIADCVNDILYVAHARGVTGFRIATGEHVRTISLSEEVGVVTGQGDVVGRYLVLPGLVGTPEDSMQASLATALQGVSIGARVSLDDGMVSSMLPLLSEGCRNRIGDCVNASVAVIRGDPQGWVACQDSAAMVGVYDQDGAIVRTIDIRSPRFLNDGTVVRGGGIPESIRWSQRNSSVYRCAVLGDFIVSVHVTFDEGEWSPGTAMSLITLANIHTIDGQPIVSDIGLPDLPAVSTIQRDYLGHRL